MENNPFKPPEARVADTAHGSGEFIPGGRKVPAGNAVGWISQGWEIFQATPGVWIVFFALISVFNTIANIAENVSFASPVADLLTPIFIGGAMIGCKRREEGKNLSVGWLFAALHKHAGSLLPIGLVDAAGLFITGHYSKVFSANAETGDWEQAIAGSIGMVFLSVLVTMFTFYAPALAPLHGIAPLRAMQSSFFSCIRNFAAFAIYLLLVGMLIALPIFILRDILPGSLAEPFVFLGNLVVMPVIFLSTYAAYRDIFTDNP